MKLAGQTTIITGGSQGLGREIAGHFLRAGANVMICARNAELLSETANELAVHAGNGHQIQYYPADVCDPSQVEGLVNQTLKLFGKIDVLVLNAGIYGTKGAIEEVCWEDWSRAIDINLKGSVLPARLVVPHMKKNGHGKIIFISGGGATKPLPGLSAYAASKAGVVRFAETLAEELCNSGIDVNSVAPGALNTRLLEEILSAGPDKVGEEFYQRSLRQKAEGGTPLSVGAELCVYLASEESNGITGRLISAVWDKWQQFSGYKDEIRGTDLFTLRRIIPEDRDIVLGEQQ